jgi:hypothetical protein
MTTPDTSPGMRRTGLPRLRQGLESLALAGDDLVDLAPHIIASADYKTLVTFASNIASLARAALREGEQ